MDERNGDGNPENIEMPKSKPKQKTTTTEPGPGCWNGFQETQHWKSWMCWMAFLTSLFLFLLVENSLTFMILLIFASVLYFGGMQIQKIVLIIN